MIANLHTHTYRCHHASDTEREYVLRAIEGGFRMLGFSDHTPYPFTGTDYASRIRMSLPELSGYVVTIHALKKEFAEKIDIHLGVEAEYYPKFFPELVETLRCGGVEYMILGQHFVNNEFDGVYTGRPFSDEKILDKYCGQAMDAMDTGLFTYFAHPDLAFFTGSSQVYDEKMRKMIRFAADHHVPLEINLAGMRTERNYPNPRFWKIAAEEGAAAVIGSDAHAAWEVWDPDLEEKARKLAADCGLQIAEQVPIVQI